MDAEIVSNPYESYFANAGKSLEAVSEFIDDQCRQWMCIRARAETDAEKRGSEAVLYAYKECLKLIDTVGQKHTETEAALAESQRREQAAVDAITGIGRAEHICWMCNNTAYAQCHSDALGNCGFEWRRPQEDGEARQ